MTSFRTILSQYQRNLVLSLGQGNLPLERGISFWPSSSMIFLKSLEDSHSFGLSSNRYLSIIQRTILTTKLLRVKNLHGTKFTKLNFVMGCQPSWDSWVHHQIFCFFCSLYLFIVVLLFIVSIYSILSISFISVNGWVFFFKIKIMRQ